MKSIMCCFFGYMVVTLFLAAISMGGYTPLHAHGAIIEKVATDDLPVFDDDEELRLLADAVSASIEYFDRFSGEKKFAYGRDQYTAKQLASGLRYFMNFIETGPAPHELSQFINKNGLVYAHKKDGEYVNALFTGYFEPAVSGSLKKNDTFQYPVYSRPDDLVVVNLSSFSLNCDQQTIIGRYDGKEVVPYFSRREIETGAIVERAVPIAWVSDPVALFFLHVQGSGKIIFENGRHINVHYDISNGLAYKSIGRYLIDAGRIAPKDMSMQAIADYIRDNPIEKKDILQYNPRYIFFREGAHGVRGCLSVPLTAGRSIALDQAVSPSGSLMFIKSRKPVCNKDGSIDKWIDFSRFAVNQDTGSAIRGASRADLFWGSGEYAEIAAGHMKHPGRIYFIVILPDI